MQKSFKRTIKILNESYKTNILKENKQLLKENGELQNKLQQI